MRELNRVNLFCGIVALFICCFPPYNTMTLLGLAIGIGNLIVGLMP